MSDTLAPLIAATAAFVFGHFILSWAPVRGALVARPASARVASCRSSPRAAARD